ncbi:4-(cytidine 5'-diphospho)-2-C-methyl-D-erythritol kinase [Treponema sp. HNW]|uniref:4-(cytidine 5'-diphospho)-2-C-methyl-D-erythritol kinase n=1 Tax=Treponema sp. HNW TaxID=3116654 RepID=UPI003D0E05C8
MPNNLRIRASAKLNLHLRVLSPDESGRSDGYHNIESVLQAVDLYDELTVSKTAENRTCRLEVNGMELPAHNTLTAAYTEFCNLTGVSDGVRVVLTKRIPAGAGLGGGSSDAAAFLTVLDRLFNTELSPKQRLYAASRIGSDVAFFLSGGCAVVTGRGELVREIEARTDLFFVLVQPDVHSSTKEAYALLDERMNRPQSKLFPPLADLENIYRKPAADWTFANSFTEPLTESYPVIAGALESVKACRADFADMTGAGSMVYGVFSSETEAKNAYAQLCGDWRCFFVKPCKAFA